MGLFPCCRLLQSLKIAYVIKLNAWSLYSLTVHLVQKLSNEGPLESEPLVFDHLPGWQYGKPFFVPW